MMRNGNQRPAVADWNGLAASFDELFLIAQSFPKADPAAVFYQVPDEHRHLALLQFAYMTGDFSLVKDIFNLYSGDLAARLVVGPWAVAAAIAMGDWQFYDEVDAFLSGFIDPLVPASMRSYAEFAISIGSIGARSLYRVPDWVTAGEWTDLPPLARFAAAEQSAEYFEFINDFEAMLRTARMALDFVILAIPPDKMSIVEINLRIRVALAFKHLGDTAAAKHWMHEAMQLALPHGYIVPFAQKSASGGRIIEQLLKEHYPQLVDKYLQAAESITRNWVIFRLTRIHPKDGAPTLVRALTNEELEMTYAAGLGKSNAEIAETFRLAEGTVKNRMRLIYEKLGLNSTRPRSELRQVLWGDGEADRE